MRAARRPRRRGLRVSSSASVRANLREKASHLGAESSYANCPGIQSASGCGTPARTSHCRSRQHLEDETMKLAIALAAAACIALAIPAAQADETRVGVGVVGWARA